MGGPRCRVGAVRRWLLDKPEMEPEALAEVRARLERVLATLVAEAVCGLSVRMWLMICVVCWRRSIGVRRCPEVWDGPALGRMPGGPGRDGLSPALAAAEALAGLRDCQGLGQQRRPSGRNSRTMRWPSDAVLAHVGQRHGLEAAHQSSSLISVTATVSTLTPLIVRSGRCWAASWTVS